MDTDDGLPSMNDHADALHPAPGSLPAPGILMPNGRKQIPSRPGKGGDFMPKRIPSRPGRGGD